MPNKMEPIQTMMPRGTARLTLTPLLYTSQPRTGAKAVMMMREVEEMPPICAFGTPLTMTVFTMVWSGASLIISSGTSDVRETAVNPRKAEVRSTSIRMAKLMNRKKPVLPRDSLAISAMDLPFSRTLANSTVIS